MTIPQGVVARARWSLAPGSWWGVAGYAVWAVSWGSVALGLLIALLHTGDESALGFEIYGEFFVPDAIIAVLFGPASAVVLRRSGHPVGWIFAAVALGFGLSAFGIQYTLLGASRDDLPAYAFVAQLTTAAWLVGAFAGLLVLPWILDRTSIRRRWRFAAFVGVALTAFAFGTRMLIQIDGGPRPPWSPSPRVSQWAYDVDAWIIPFYFFYGLTGAIVLVLRYRRASADQRRGVTWVVASLFLAAVSYILFETGMSVDGPLLSIASAALFAAHFMLLVAVFVLVVRQPQWGMDVAVSRATVWALLTAAVIATYLALVWVAGQVFPLDENESGVVVAALLALAVTPVRRWMQGRVDRLVYGSASDVEILLANLGADASQERPGRSSLESLAEGLRRSMRLRFVGVDSLPGLSAVTASAGERGTAATSIPLKVQGRDVGSMEVTPYGGERLDVRTMRLLEQVAGLVAVALELAQVNDQLASARTRLVDVRQEERRLLRRELHDGLGPALAGASLALAAIGNNNRSLSAADSRLLGQLQEELSRRAEDVRGIARALLPPALDDGRLGAALEVLAERFSDSGFKVRVEADEPDRIDTKRQVAAYHVAAEGVLNAYRHAGARECVLSVKVDEAGAVTVMISDDGVGIAGGNEKGIGITSMNERAAELGGTFSISDSEEGTTVQVVLP